MIASTGGLPVEMIATGASIGIRVTTLPSTTALTLPVVAPHLVIECWEVPDGWSPSAPAAMRSLAGTISTVAPASSGHRGRSVVVGPVLTRS